MLNAQLDTNPSVKRRLRRCHLAACLATALGLGGLTSPAIAANLVVQVCSDADYFHAGQPPIFLRGLRSQVASAQDGDTIDMTALSNCTITLTAGEIPITVNNLTFNGPPGHPVTIDAHKASRIFDHTGTGTVTLNYLALTNGYSGSLVTSSKQGFGGCIYSSGSLSLAHSVVSSCAAGYGGATFVDGNISLNRSVVTSNISTTPINYKNVSPTIFAGTLYAKYSQINNNHGTGIVGRGGAYLIESMVNGNTGGGIYSRDGRVTLTSSTVDGNGASGIRGVFDVVTVDSSTISNNRTNGFGAGIYLNGSALTVTSSTISGNSSSAPIGMGGGGGISAYTSSMKISNSTIAFNSAPSGGGIYNFANDFCGTVTLESSILADNSATDNNKQFYSDAAGLAGCTISGSNNLVGVVSFSLSGTLTGSPGLAPLAYHGGAVKTHALLATSPAIDAGNNLLNLAGDERGLPRVVGAAADIGAYERQANDDEIFYNGFQ